MWFRLWSVQASHQSSGRAMKYNINMASHVASLEGENFKDFHEFGLDDRLLKVRKSFRQELIISINRSFFYSLMSFVGNIKTEVGQTNPYPGLQFNLLKSTLELDKLFIVIITISRKVLFLQHWKVKIFQPEQRQVLVKLQRECFNQLFIV